MRRGFVAAFACASVVTAIAAPCLAAGMDKAMIPSRKAGMWDLVLSAPGRPDVTMTMCIDAKTDREMMDAWLSPVTNICPDQTWRRDNDTIVIESDCTAGGRTVVSRAELAGDFQREHTLRIHTKSGLGEANTVDLTQTMRFVSETCGSGLIPGGVKLPNGAKMNMKRMMKLIENMNEPK